MPIHIHSNYPEVARSDDPPEVVPPALTQLQPDTKSNYLETHSPSNNPASLTLRRWIILGVVGIGIALVSGTLGGFIGKAIESKAHRNPQPPSPTSANTTTTTTTSRVTIPGCIGENNLTSQVSSFLHTKYTAHCGTDWAPNADITGVFAETPSDCVEACYVWNKHGLGNPKCVGAAYIERFLNRTVAMGVVKYPVNCYLKSGDRPVVKKGTVAVLELEG